ncbi:MAG: HEPN domain-containing protein [Chloroflexota bacterium]|nr:HEPN domain-containing protein [Chloroflexota bacterium]
MREETTEWLASATEDFDAAQVLFDAGQYHAMALHAQQSVEKGLKGLLVERTGELPARTHDLRRIGTEVGIPAVMLSRLVELYAYYLAGRYPGTAHGDAQLRATEEATAALATARDTLSWTREQLASVGPEQASA